MLWAESNTDPSAFVVSLYQLEHKPGKEAKHLADKGFEMLKHRDYQAAAELFDRANKLDDDYWDAQITWATPTTVWARTAGQKRHFSERSKSILRTALPTRISELQS